jgi:glycerol-3-phosphate acyltransferase PlsY
MNILFGLLAAYLLGSIPTAYIFGKVLKGIDIREHGSGNVGATNAFRVLGKGPGTVVLLVDIAKGFLAVTLVGDFFGLDKILFRVLLALIAVSGHNWTVFLQFKGGKGIATSLGVLIGLAVKIAVLRPVLLICILTWTGVFFTTGYVSLASILAVLALSFSMLMTQSLELVILGVIFCIFVVLRHQANIHRILSGTESQVPLPWKKGKK